MRNSKGKKAAASRRARKKSKDRISELPDDILISIISRLSVQEAIFTGILSTRWRYLYTHVTRLDFQPLKLSKDINLDALMPCPRRNRQIQTPQGQLQEEVSMQVDWISRVLDSYKESQVLKEIRFNVPRASQLDIDKWLEITLSRGTETLHVQVENRLFTDHHSYPIEMLILGGQCFTSLKTLSLCNLRLHSGELQLLISNCNVLKRLSITSCSILGDLVIIGRPELKLKQLELDHLSWHVKVQIRDLIHLVFFRYCRLDIRSTMKNVPKLSNMEIDKIVYESHMEALVRLLGDTHGLAKLTLGINPSEIKDYGWSSNLKKLMNLKHLVLRVEMNVGSCILALTPLIEASPFLEKLDIEFSWRLPNFRNRDIINRDLREHPHYNLKKVKFSGYLGSPHESEFAFYIFKNAVKLEEFVVEGWNKRWMASRKVRKEATLAHRQFQAKAPKSVKLVIH